MLDQSIRNVLAATPPDATAKLLLTAREAAALCGKSVRTWRSWDAAGYIPRPLRVGRSLLWRTDELRRWVAAGCPARGDWESAAF